MKIVCVGLGKTGTQSLGLALELLGYDVISWKERAIQLYLNGDFEQLRNDYILHWDVFREMPWPKMYKYFDENFNTKFILTTRKTSEIWYNSSVNYQKKIGGSKLKDSYYGCPIEDKKGRILFYENHNQEIRDYFKNRDHFLEMNLEEGDGWDELLNFICKKPSVPFPHINKGSSVNKNYRI
jgi:hypothetical protein